jgi:CHAT domain-containing protein
MDLLDREWLALGRDASKITFRAFLASVYQDYVDFLSRQNQKERALEVAEASRARLLAQKLEGGSDLPRFRAREAVELARATNTLLLSYWLAPERSYLWAVTASGVSQFVLPAESRINQLVEQHRHAIEALQDPLSEGSTASRELYTTLIAPVEPLVHSARQVIIVPDGSLHSLNFETLVVDGPTPHYWIEDATVALVPSLAILRVKPPQPARTPRLLVVGDPLPADPAYPPLPHLKTEIRTIAADFPEPDRAIYTGAAAYAEHFREAGPAAYSAIHFAAHASANDESPLNSAIILSPHGGKYKLYVSDLTGLRIEPDVVTISACRGAGARAYSGEGLIGFAWAFLEAGAHNVVAGIWNVDDAAAPLLMQEFYKHWRAHGNSAAALRNAKLKLMRSGGAFRKPYYWGPFEIFTRQATRSAMDLAWRNSSR